MATFVSKYNIGDSLYYILRNGEVKKAEVISIIINNDNSIDYKLRLDDGDKNWLSCSTLIFYTSKEEIIYKIKKEIENLK